MAAVDSFMQWNLPARQISKVGKSRQSITDLILHIHPRTVSRETLRFTLSFGLGGMAVVLVGLLFSTGILLLFVYQPAIDLAYSTILTLTREVPLGPWVRNIHHWSGNLLVMIALLHLLRVVLTGAFGPGRRLNWIIGLLLFFLLLAANFTGYLLPWDQLAYWAVTICTSMLGYFPFLGIWLQELFRGGAEIGPGHPHEFFCLPRVIYSRKPGHFAALPFLADPPSQWPGTDKNKLLRKRLRCSAFRRSLTLSSEKLLSDWCWLLFFFFWPSSWTLRCRRRPTRG